MNITRVTPMSPGAAGIVSSLTAWMLRSQIRVLQHMAVALIFHCGFVVDTQEFKMESSLEMSAVTGTITAAITGLTPLKSKPVQAIIMSMSWLDQLWIGQPTVQVIIFIWTPVIHSWYFVSLFINHYHPNFQMSAALTAALQPSHQRPSQLVM